MAQECEAQLGVAADAIETAFGDGVDLTDRRTTQIGKFGRFEIAKDLLGWIEFTRVGRQAFDRRTRALSIDPVGHATTAVGRQAIS